MSASNNSNGRPRGFGRAKQIHEKLVGIAYAGDWPARIWNAMVPASRRVEIRRYSIAASGLGEPASIAFISDLHMGPTTHPALIEAAFRTLERCKPDIVVFGGDYVYLPVRKPQLRFLTEMICGLSAAHKFAVMGNHDLWTDHRAIRSALEEGGATMITNRNVSLPHPWPGIHVAGLDDPYSGHPDARAAFSGIETDATIVAVCHAPDGLLHLNGYRFAAFLCGHTHGGQIASPFGPIVVPAGKLSREYSGGVYENGDATVIVSRGVGTVELPVRLWARPDIVILDLLPEAGNSRD